MKKKSKRKVVVLSSLVALLSLTSALLLALAPPPLSADGYNSLSAADRPEFLDDIFKTAIVPRINQWKYIYIHQSGSATGSATSLSSGKGGLADHFVIGNGSGSEDGEIEIGQRWNRQQAAAAPPGVDSIDPACVSICLIGNFDTSMPTPVQLRRLAQLVSTLQSQFRISSQNVVMLSQRGTPSGVGRYFPTTAFHDEILP